MTAKTGMPTATTMAISVESRSTVLWRVTRLNAQKFSDTVGIKTEGYNRVVGLSRSA